MFNTKIFRPFIYLFAATVFLQASCNYKMIDASIPPTHKTIRIQPVEHRARILNPALSPALTERLRQKITGQTRLTAVNPSNEDAHYDISAWVTDYAVTTAGVALNNGQTQSAVNRLTVSIHVVKNDQVRNVVDEFDVSKSFDFDANTSLQTAESQLLTEMVRTLTDEIFNRIFSDWK